MGTRTHIVDGVGRSFFTLQPRDSATAGYTSSKKKYTWPTPRPIKSNTRLEFHTRFRQRRTQGRKGAVTGNTPNRLQETGNMNGSLRSA